MSGEFDRAAVAAGTEQSPAGADDEVARGAVRAPSFPPGWYYFGPYPPTVIPPACGASWPSGPPGPWTAMPSGPAAWGPPLSAAAPPHASPTGGDSHFKEALERLAKGDLSAETIGKLLSLDDGDFWKGALAGAAAALLVAKLPMIMRLFTAAAQHGGGGQETEPSPAAGAGELGPNEEVAT